MTLFNKISNFIYLLKYRIKNLLIWFKVIWYDSQFDYCYLLEIIIFKMKLMEDFFKKDGIIAYRDKVAKQILICRNLFKRLKADDYIMSQEYSRLWEINHKEAIKFERYMVNQDLELIGNIFKKHLRGWWN